MGRTNWDEWRGIEPVERREYGQLLEGARIVASAAIAATSMDSEHPYYEEWAAHVNEQPYMGV